MNWWSPLVKGSYPPASTFDHDGEITISELERFVRIIITEGVPFACSEFPMAFEYARSRAAKELGMDPKQLSLVGSARIGYSLSPKKFGEPFVQSTSDIDLFAVSAELFGEASGEFWKFLKAWDEGSINPPHPGIEVHWQSHRKYDPNNIQRGFLNPDHVPTWNQFPVSRRVVQAAYLFHVTLEKIVGKKIGKRATIRVYKDWTSTFRQITFSLRSALRDRV